MIYIYIYTYIYVCVTRGSLVGPAMDLLDQAVAWASQTGPVAWTPV